MKISPTILLATLALLSCTPRDDADVAQLMAQAEEARRAHDDVRAAQNFHAAAQAGNAEAQMRLGALYLEGGPDLPPDYESARLWSLRAAAQGNGGALLTLGILYRKGLGVQADKELALDYFRKAEKAGQFKAPRYIGLYYQDQGDDAKAVACFRQAALAGDITSQYYLGQAYEKGKGVAADFAKARTWYATAAARGDLIASDGMVGLAGLAEKGAGEPRDPVKALRLYRQAATLGNANAKTALTRLGAPLE